MFHNTVANKPEELKAMPRILTGSWEEVNTSEGNLRPAKRRDMSGRMSEEDDDEDDDDDDDDEEEEEEEAAADAPPAVTAEETDASHLRRRTSVSQARSVPSALDVTANIDGVQSCDATSELAPSAAKGVRKQKSAPVTDKSCALWIVMSAPESEEEWRGEWVICQR